jgi:hypothetical protein
MMGNVDVANKGWQLTHSGSGIANSFPEESHPTNDSWFIAFGGLANNAAAKPWPVV